MAYFRRLKSYAAGSPDRLEYVAGRKYTPAELERIADTLLHDDPKPSLSEPMILTDAMSHDRRRKEIYAEAGSVDPGLVSGIYWRTHPQGRQARPDQQSKDKGAKGFYR